MSFVDIISQIVGVEIFVYSDNSLQAVLFNTVCLLTRYLNHQRKGIDFCCDNVSAICIKCSSLCQREFQIISFRTYNNWFGSKTLLLTILMIKKGKN